MFVSGRVRESGHVTPEHFAAIYGLTDGLVDKVPGQIMEVVRFSKDVPYAAAE